jgi:hypothetical protein
VLGTPRPHVVASIDVHIGQTAGVYVTSLTLYLNANWVSAKHLNFGITVQPSPKRNEIRLVSQALKTNTRLRLLLVLEAPPLLLTLH